MFVLTICMHVCMIWMTAQASVVVTTSGPVRGALTHEYGVSYYAYQGIPYAESPTGNLRFKPPVPKSPWSEVLDATKPGPACPQPSGRIARANMSEDCLNINVFVPANRTTCLPVLVYVHGGGFKSNSGNIDDMFGPQLLLKRGIIHVSVNFRLGSLGFLSLKTEESSGNMGLKDLLLALKWVKSNIHKFGGSTITIGGQSSGSAMVHHMLLTEKSTGLFDRAILNSGSATNYRFLSRYPREYALALANELGFESGNDDIILSNLREANVFDIIDAQENIYKNIRNVMTPQFAPFVPCIERESEHSVLTKDPFDIINAGIPQNVPILAGINSREGAYMWPTLHTKTETFLKEQFPLAIPGDIEYPDDSDKYHDLVNSISKLYFGDVHLTNWTLNNFYDLLSDAQYTYCVGSWIKVHKERKDSEKLYYYEFKFDGELNWSKVKYNISFPGAVHTDEIGYIFVNQATKDKLNKLDKRSQRTLDNMLTFVSNFVKFGEPTPVYHEGRAVWAGHGGAGRHLVIGDSIEEASPAPFEARFTFWTNVYEQYREYLRSGGVRKTRITS